MTENDKTPSLEVDTSEINSYQPENIKVLVGVTGSIDSLVTAFLLKKQGFQVIALAINTWSEGTKDREEVAAPKCYIKDLDKLRNICDKIDVQFYASEAKSRFDLEVLEIFLANKLTGMANISCMYCTSTRFHILYEKMKKLNCHFIATGHFAKMYKNHQNGEYFIHSANDKNYDQSTLMAGLPQEILRKTLLPLAELKKSEVEIIAKNFGLDMNGSRDSSEMCFSSNEKIVTLIEKRVPKSLRSNGNILFYKSEKYMAEQSGLYNFQLGDKQLKDSAGGRIDLKKGQEVVKFNYKNSIVYVGDKSYNETKGVQAINVSFSSEMDRTKPMKVYCKVNCNNEYFEATLFYKNNSSLYIEFKEPRYLLVENDKIIFYDKNTKGAKILGHGFIAMKGEYSKIDRTKEYKSDKKDFTGLASNRKEKSEETEPEFGF